MGKPITPMVGCDVFVLNSRGELLLIQRSDTGLWALPGGCQDLGETPRDCAERECLEETGFSVRVTALLGVWSSECYEYVTYPWKENEFCHLMFRADLIGGSARASTESLSVAWFDPARLPRLADGHEARVRYGIATIAQPSIAPHFE